MFRRLTAAAVLIAACVGGDPDVTPSTVVDAGTDAGTDGGIEDALPPGEDAAPPCSMISWWTGDQVLADKLGVNNLVVVEGAPAYEIGKFNAAFSFDRTRIFGTTTTAGLGGSKQLTVEGWVKLATCASDARRLIEHQTESNEGFYVDFIEDGGTMRARVGQAQASAPGISNDVFLHFAATYDGTTLILYANGIEVGRDVLPAGADVPSTTAPLKLGAAANDSFRYCGLADEIALYGRALSKAEIEALHLNGPTARCKN